MIAEGGLAALWLAAMMAVLQLLLASSAVIGGRPEMVCAVRPVAIAQGGLLCIPVADDDRCHEHPAGDRCE